MYHIVASDMDGTLLGPDHKLSPFTKETLKLLTAKEIHFIFATGRHHIDIAQIKASLGIKAYMITSNGARVHDSDNTLIFSHNVDADIARDLYHLVYSDPDIETHVYKNDDWFTNRDCADADEFFQESVFNYQLFNADELDTEGVCKVFYTCPSHERLTHIEDAINARWGDRVNASFSTVNCLEIMAGGVSKGHALDAVANLLGYGLKDCIAFGDGMNDVEMLNMAAKGCIMENAHQRLKDTLPEIEVIGSNRDDAVAHYLRRLYQV
jgi:Cof subfamily protein (haloacid dehalogenase superfamily)